MLLLLRQERLNHHPVEIGSETFNAIENGGGK
jgi:hypothetical protein